MEKEKWVVTINAHYPRILFNSTAHKPERVRFMSFRNIGVLQLSERGQVLTKPRYYDVVGEIKKRLEAITSTVEKALIKVAANKFSLLTFPEHMFTPIQDILSWLLTKDRLDLESFLQMVWSDKREKYVQNIKILQEVGLVRQENGLVLPADLLIELEMRENLTTSQKLSGALTLFYERGYDNLETIRAFLGPHLTISAHIYELSLESGSPLSMTSEDLEELFAATDRYKIIKVPRYILQLEEVGILTASTTVPNAWEPNKALLDKLCSEEDLLTPLREALV